MTTIINVDMDGVTADFNSHYLRITGKPFSNQEKAQVRWDRLRGKEIGFYRGISPFWGAYSFIVDLKEQFPDCHVRLLSAKPSLLEFPTIEAEKKEWSERILGPDLELVMAQSSATKYQFANPGDLLIDDNPLNIQQWNAAKGIGILHTTFENDLEYVKRILK
jgi:5'(3')-deoxyribonucleotidase